MERKSGYYWVLVESITQDWDIAFYSVDFKKWSYDGKTLSDRQFDEIDERRIERIN